METLCMNFVKQCQRKGIQHFSKGTCCVLSYSRLVKAQMYSFLVFILDRRPYYKSKL